MIDGTNRALLLLLGLLLAAAGALGLALNQGLIDGVDQPGSVYADVREDLVADPDLWFAVVLGASVVVMVLALVWAARQFTSRPGPPHLSTVVLHADRQGRTTLEPAGLAQAIAGDIGTVDGVRKARVRIVAMGREPSMHVRLDVHRAVDPDALLQRLEPPLERAAESMGVSTVEARVRIDFAGRDTDRVV